MLEVIGLKTYYQLGDCTVKSVDGVDFSLEKGEILGLTGESGAGKSTVGYSIMGYLPYPGKITGGTILFRGSDLIADSRKFRWKEISMIFQGAMNAMNPLLKIGKQINEVLKVHTKLHRSERKERIKELLELVRIDPKRASDYPHQLSGGMKQRIMIAMALACNPAILIADEPTTNLDVITQKKIIDLLMELRQQFGLSVIFISHDLALINQICERVAVFNNGKIIEYGRTDYVFNNPCHLHTKKLIDSVRVKEECKRQAKRSFAK